MNPELTSPSKLTKAMVLGNDLNVTVLIWSNHAARVLELAKTQPVFVPNRDRIGGPIGTLYIPSVAKAVKK